MKRRTVAAVVISLLVLLIVGALAADTIIEGKYNRVRNDPPYVVPFDTARLHERLFIADLHADSLLWGRDLLKHSAKGHIDIPRLQQANVALQVFTVVTTIPRNLKINRNSSSSDLVRYMAIAQGWPPRTWNSPKNGPSTRHHDCRSSSRNLKANSSFCELGLSCSSFFRRERPSLPTHLGVQDSQIKLSGKSWAGILRGFSLLLFQSNDCDHGIMTMITK